MNKVARIYELKEDRRKWKTYQRYARKYRAGVSEVSSSKTKNTF